MWVGGKCYDFKVIGKFNVEGVDCFIIIVLIKDCFFNFVCGNIKGVCLYGVDINKFVCYFLVVGNIYDIYVVCGFLMIGVNGCISV